MSDNEDAIWLDYLMGYADALEADSSKKDQQFRLVQALRAVVTLAKNQGTNLTELREQFQNRSINYNEQYDKAVALRMLLREIVDFSVKNRGEQAKWVKTNLPRMRKILEG
jgi:hypothetical protein